jgi:hypothetical protein
MVTLTKRERNLAIGAGATIGCLLVYFVIISPVMDEWASIQQGQRDVRQQLSDAQMVFDSKIKMQKVWNVMLKSGLQNDASLAESQAENAAYKLAEQAGVTDISLRAERPADEGSFEVTGFSIEGIGSMRQISQLVYLLESATIPLRVNDLQITPVPEGTDHLKVHLGFSTLCLLAPEKTAAAKGAHS